MLAVGTVSAVRGEHGTLRVQERTLALEPAQKGSVVTPEGLEPPTLSSED